MEVWKIALALLLVMVVYGYLKQFATSIFK